MKQQSSCPVELRGELLKAESLRDGQHVSQMIRCRGRLTVKITALMNNCMPICMYILELSDYVQCTDLMYLIFKNITGCDYGNHIALITKCNS